MEVRKVGNINGHTGGNYAYQVYDSNGLSPTLTDMQGGGRQPHTVEVKKMERQCVKFTRKLANEIVDVCNTLTANEPSRTLENNNPITGVCEAKKIKIRQATKDGFIECVVPGIADLNYVSSTTRMGRVVDGGVISPTLTTENIPSVIEFGNEKFYNFLYEIDGELYLIRIRKLTERECGRLMGFTEDDISAMCRANSRTQVYKQCGNSIVRNCLIAIFGQMFEGKEEVYKSL